MKQKLLADGWVIFYHCNCGGTPKDYYSNKAKPGFEIIVREKLQTFMILKDNHIIAGPFYAYIFDEKMKQYIS